MQKVIECTNAVPRHQDFRLPEPLNFSISAGERVAILGGNGSGKTKLVNILTNSLPLSEGSVSYSFDVTKERVSDNIKCVTFRDISDGALPDYYQQRYNRGDLAEAHTTVKDVIARKCRSIGARQQEILNQFRLDKLWGKPLIFLSSGELRKVQICKQLLTLPRLLIIDSPYIGLDADARERLNEILDTLPRELSLIVVVCREEDIPPCCTRTFRLSSMSPKSLTTEEKSLLTTLAKKEKKDVLKYDDIIRFKDINISYDGHCILSNVNWEVKKGERWALKGGNGSGKTTLLSLVLADNPIAYALNIALFGKKRGKGESIWDIKKHIGYVSPELHRTYQHDIPAIHIVASGAFDTVGLYRKPNEATVERCRRWMEVFRCAHLAERSYVSLSSGEQRLILLVRAFVKSPSLLVLDEPFHGLDTANRTLAKEIIETYAQMPGKTLIMVTHYDEEFPACINKTKVLTQAPHSQSKHLQGHSPD